MSKYGNVFNLEHPEAWACYLSNFVNTHHLLSIQIQKDNTNERLYIGFRKVIYYAGSTSWKGADFRLFEGRAMSDFLNARQVSNSLVEDALSRSGNYRLFHVNNRPQQETIIIANAGWCRDEEGTTLTSVPSLT